MTRILIGPANHAGQAASWAAALRQVGERASSLSFRPRPRVPWKRISPLVLPTDLRVPFPKVTTPYGRIRRARRILTSFSHFALDGFVPLLGSTRQGLTQLELDQLSGWGARLALIAHGSDVRDPTRHMQEIPGSYFPLLDPALRVWLDERSTSNRELAERSGLPLFVSTPDLLVDLPRAQWLPLCVDRAAWDAAPRQKRSRPRFLHAPTSGMKGSDVIDPILRQFEDRGVIDYVRASGVPYTEMPGLMSSADVVIDQIRSGSYGATTVEAMMSGAVVVGHVAAPVLELLPENPGVVDAAPHAFAAAIEDLLDSRAIWPEIADRSRQYAHTWHDGAASSRALSEFINSS